MMKRITISLMVLLLVVGCRSKKPVLSFYETESDNNTECEYSDDAESTDKYLASNVENEIEVPFYENGGVKYIKVTINGSFTIDMILDSGCSTTLISVAEADYLYKRNCFSEDDILGIGQSSIADGSIVENTRIILRSVVIGDKIVCDNVEAMVSNSTDSPLLLGNEVLNRAASYSVDNENKVIRFRLRRDNE